MTIKNLFEIESPQNLDLFTSLFSPDWQVIWKNQEIQGGPLLFINGTLILINMVLTPVTHLFSAIYIGASFHPTSSDLVGASVERPKQLRTRSLTLQTRTTLYALEVKSTIKSIFPWNC